MKKKIAVCGNGWSNEYLEIVMSGIRKCAEENNADIFFMFNFSVTGTEEFMQTGGVNIDRLLEFGEFDGVILLANTFHLQPEFEYLCKIVKEKELPAVSLEYHLPEIDFFGSDNYAGMYELCLHLVEEHQAKDVVFISGPKDNAESSTRRQALEDALGTKGLTLKEENVLFCNWNYYEVEPQLSAWLDKHSKLPDVIVCANDVMAMAACAVLENRDISVPDDVKLTGYDHLLSVRSYYPIISTVDRNWDDMGYQGLQFLLNKIDGKEAKGSRKINSRAVIGESCGCAIHDIKRTGRRIRENRVYANYVENSFWAEHLCDMTDHVSASLSAEEVHDRFNKFLQTDHGYEGDEIYICLVNNFFSSLKENVPLGSIGYTDTMDVICGLKDGMPIKRTTINTGDLVPDYNSEDSSKMYVFLPLYSKEGCYGYVVLGKEVPMLYNYSAYNWIRSIEQSFSRVRQNIIINVLNSQLKELSVTDGLTGVYNRIGCEKIAYPFIEKCHKQGKRAVLMFADINKMKVINDKYGHLQGDTAITTVASVIKEVLQDDWIVVRYGGDEFLMVGECADESKLDDIIIRMNETLKVKTAQMELPYTLRAGIGYVMINEKEELDLVECLRKADEAMYQMKKRQHEELSQDV